MNVIHREKSLLLHEIVQINSFFFLMHLNG